MQNQMIAAYCAVQAFIVNGIYNFKNKERGAVNVVEIVVIIGIAVLLAVIFRKQIQGLLEQLFNSINGNATKAVN